MSKETYSAVTHILLTYYTQFRVRVFLITVHILSFRDTYPYYTITPRPFGPWSVCVCVCVCVCVGQTAFHILITV